MSIFLLKKQTKGYVPCPLKPRPDLFPTAMFSCVFTKRDRDSQCFNTEPKCAVAPTAQLLFNSTAMRKNEHSLSRRAEPTDSPRPRSSCETNRFADLLGHVWHRRECARCYLSACTVLAHLNNPPPTHTPHLSLSLSLLYNARARACVCVYVW